MHRFIAFVLMVGLLLGGSLSFAVAPSARVLIEQKISQYVREKIPGLDKAKIEAKIQEDYGKLSQWDDHPVEFGVGKTLAGFRPLGSVVVPIEVFQKSQRMDLFFVKASVSAELPVVVSARKVDHGQKIVPEDLQYTVQDISYLPRQYFLNGEKIVGKEAMVNIPEGRTLMSWMVREDPLIHKNGPVTLVTQARGVRVEATGIALDDGYMGKNVRVRNRSSLRELVGRVIGPSKVELVTSE